MDILSTLKQELTCYENIQTEKNIVNSKAADIAIIIPVHGRVDYNQPVTDYFYRAIQNYKRQVGFHVNISITIVEHSPFAQHKSVCRPFVNYIHIPQSGPFNKCLAFNIGAIENKNANLFLFHDIDIIVPKTYFKDLFENYARLKGGAMQTFTQRRLLHCNTILTESALNNTHIIQDFSTGNPGLKVAQPGAAGGSILVSKKAFIQAGGWNDIFFTEYSLEDQFFFDKVQMFKPMGFADNPAIELLHLEHPPSFNKQTKESDWIAFHAFHALSREEKLHFIEVERDHIKKYLS